MGGGSSTQKQEQHELSGLPPAPAWPLASETALDTTAASGKGEPQPQRRGGAGQKVPASALALLAAGRAPAEPLGQVGKGLLSALKGGNLLPAEASNGPQNEPQNDADMDGMAKAVAAENLASAGAGDSLTSVSPPPDLDTIAAVEATRAYLLQEEEANAYIMDVISGRQLDIMQQRVNVSTAQEALSDAVQEGIGMICDHCRFTAGADVEAFLWSDWVRAQVVGQTGLQADLDLPCELSGVTWSENQRGVDAEAHGELVVGGIDGRRIAWQGTVHQLPTGEPMLAAFFDYPGPQGKRYGSIQITGIALTATRKARLRQDSSWLYTVLRTWPGREPKLELSRQTIKSVEATVKAEQKLMRSEWDRLRKKLPRAGREPDEPVPTPAYIFYCTHGSAEIEDWSVEDVSVWLAQISGLKTKRCTAAFAKHEIDGARLVKLTIEELASTIDENQPEEERYAILAARDMEVVFHQMSARGKEKESNRQLIRLETTGAHKAAAKVTKATVSTKSEQEEQAGARRDQLMRHRWQRLGEQGRAEYRRKTATDYDVSYSAKVNPPSDNIHQLVSIN